MISHIAPPSNTQVKRFLNFGESLRARGPGPGPNHGLGLLAHTPGRRAASSENDELPFRCLI